MALDKFAIKAAFEDILDDKTEERSRKEVLYILRLIKKYGKGKNLEDVLDVPCGLGRHDQWLRKLGFKVKGIDIDHDFIRAAKERYPKFKASYRVGNMSKLPYKNCSFDVILCLYSSFNIPVDKENYKVLAEFKRVLREGGLLVMDLQSKSGLKVMEGREFRTVLSDGMTKVIKVKIKGNYRVDDEVLLDSKNRIITKIKDKERLYTPQELKALVARSGFSVLSIKKAYSMSGLRLSDKQMLIVAAKV